MKFAYIFIMLALPLLPLKGVSQSNTTNDSLTIYLFLLDDCPICIQYTPTINNIYEQYGGRIGFQGYFPNFSSKPKKIEKYVSDYGIKFPVTTDYNKDQAEKWKATVTPEVILYNHTTQTIMYQGRIDNKFVRLGKRRNVVTKHDLIDAIEQTLTSSEVLTPFTDAIGCFINFHDRVFEKE